MDTKNNSPLQKLEWRCIGPFRGGRVVAVAGDPRDPAVFYFGSTGGGIWKTTDAGQYWVNISDGFFKRASVGGIAVAASEPNVIYVGTGRGHHPWQCLPRRWRVPLDGRGPHLEAPRP